MKAILEVISFLIAAALLALGAGLLALTLSPFAAAVEIIRTDRKDFDRIGESKTRWLLIVLIGWVPGTIAYATTIRRQLAD